VNTQPPEVAKLERRLQRERQARLEAESIAERATSQLYDALRELKRESALLELLEAVTKAANEGPTVADAMQVCLHRICAHTGWPVGHALVLDDGRQQQLVSNGVWHLDDVDQFAAFTAASTSLTFSQGVGLPGRVLATGKPGMIAQLALDVNFPRGRPAQEAGLQAAFAFPVMVGSEVGAVLEFFHTEAALPDHRLLEVMMQVGAQLGRIIERTQAEARLAYQALHDPLTGLPNRTLVLDRLDHGLARSRRSRSPIAVLYIDVDDFKVINDTLGHAAGDRALVAIAERLQACIRADDTVGRFGGDEFVVVLEHGEVAAQVARRVTEATWEPMVVDAHQVFVGLSVGIAVGAVTEDWDSSRLLRSADVALRVAKARGKGHYQFFDAAEVAPEAPSRPAVPPAQTPR
jgi:diguanylate cyclase (GGDEF)-like protein